MTGRISVRMFSPEHALGRDRHLLYDTQLTIIEKFLIWLEVQHWVWRPAQVYKSWLQLELTFI